MTQLKVVLEPMRRSHLPAVLEIEEQVHPGELSFRESRLYVVASVEDAVRGYAGVFYVAGEAHVTTVAVDPAWQRRSIATRLMLLLVHQTIARQIDRMTLEVRMSNHGARELYRRFGFAPAGVRKRYYPDTNEDALIMWAHDLLTGAYAERLSRIEGALEGETVDDAFCGPGGTPVEQRG